MYKIAAAPRDGGPHMTQRLDDLIVAPGTYAQPEVFDAVFEQLRRDEPVRWTQPEGYRPFWTIARFDDVRTVERKSKIFTNSPRHVLESVAEEEANRAFSGGDRAFKTIVSMDGTEHQVHRAVASGWFTTATVANLEKEISVIAKEFVDRLAEHDGAADLSRVLFARYPLRVIMTLFGVPPEDEDDLFAFSQMYVAPEDPEIAKGRSATEVRLEGKKGFFGYFQNLIADRRASPRDDLASVIANAEVDGAPIDDLAAIAYCVVIATAGHDTTSFSSSGGLYALLRRPDLLNRLRADRGLLPAAVDEMVRWVSPVKSFMRTAREDFELGGKMIKQGDSLLLNFASANRDDTVFENASDFSIDRAPHPHLGFGAGPHACLGMHLARLEMRLLFDELLDRVDDLSLTGEPDYYRGNVVQGIKSLPVSFRLVA
jgi:cytochrome P450